jgi:integrase
VSLKEARERAFEARKLLSQGVDPHQYKQDAKNAALEANIRAGETVEKITREWFLKFSKNWRDNYSEKIIRGFENNIFLHLGDREISEITPPELLSVIRRIEARGALESAHRILQNCGQVWRYAVSCGYAQRDITGDLKGAIQPANRSHLGAITEPGEIAKLLKNINGYTGSPTVKAALTLAPLVFVRPGELRQAVWSEFDFDKKIWMIPAGRMKAKRPHVVPLSSQAVDVLNELKTISSDSEYLFPAAGNKTRCMSDMALLGALRRMGYTSEEMTAHGFRAMASTNLEQLGYDSRLIEIQLAHSDKDAVRAAYKRETHMLKLPERTTMMQACRRRF